MPTRVLIVGASVRAQVESALRAGFAVDALDLFADRDTRLLIRTAAKGFGSTEQPVASSISQVQGFADVLELVDQGYQCDGAIVCGGVENRIELVEALEKRFKLLGPSSGVLCRIRDSVALYQTMIQWLSPDEIKLPSTVRQLQPPEFGHPSGSRTWLAKNDGSSGGLGVSLVGFPAFVDAPGRGGKYFQEHVLGESVSVLYLSRFDGEASQVGVSRNVTTVIGVTQQLVGDENLGASQFQYCGSVGPFDLTELGQALGDGQGKVLAQRSKQVRRIGEFLAQHYGLVGVWGIDFIINDAGAWPVDVNARLTASAELYESKIASITDFNSIIDLHIAACLEEKGETTDVDWAKFVSGDWQFVEGKLILFNRNCHPIEITSELSDGLLGQFEIDFFGSNQIGTTLADVPCAGDLIQPAHPILTIRARCGSVEEVRVELAELAKRIYRVLERKNC